MAVYFCFFYYTMLYSVIYQSSKKTKWIWQVLLHQLSAPHVCFSLAGSRISGPVGQGARKTASVEAGRALPERTGCQRSWRHPEEKTECCRWKKCWAGQQGAGSEDLQEGTWALPQRAAATRERDPVCFVLYAGITIETNDINVASILENNTYGYRNVWKWTMS